MSEENKYKNYSAADIEKYHQGLLSPKEMNELEKAALDDPFLADALEGYGKVPVNISADMAELKKKLEERVSGAKVVPIASRFSMTRSLKVAAVIAFVAGSAFFIYKFAFNNTPKEHVAKVNQPVPQTPAVPDSDKPGAVVINNNQVEKQSGAADSKSENKADLSKTISHNKNLADTLHQNNVGVVDDRDAAAVAAPVKSDTLRNQQANNFAADSKQSAALKEVVVANSQSKQTQAGERKYKSMQPGAVVSPAEKSNPAQGLMIANNDKNLATNYFRGRVMDNNNNALPFANISNTKDNVGTYADAQGNFTLISTDSVLNVRVKSVGFVPDTIQLKDNSGYNKVVLKEDVVDAYTLSGKRQAKIPSPEESIKVEESEPADGWSNYNLYVANNIKIPDGIKEKESRQEVKLSFEVNKLGQPVDIKIEKSNCKECDDEAIRLVKEGPKWKPKKKKSRVTLTIPF